MSKNTFIVTIISAACGAACLALARVGLGHWRQPETELHFDSDCW